MSDLDLITTQIDCKDLDRTISAFQEFFSKNTAHEQGQEVLRALFGPISGVINAFEEYQERLERLAQTSSLADLRTKLTAQRDAEEDLFARVNGLRLLSLAMLEVVMDKQLRIDFNMAELLATKQ